MIEKPALTRTPIADIVARRWSGRSYDPNRPVEPEKLLAALEAARWAPSCFGDEPWRFLVWDRSQCPDEWRRAFECLAESNRAWAERAPVLILAAADGFFGHNGQSNRWAQYDTGAATVSLCLQAGALGLMAHQMGGFDARRLSEEFALPERLTCMAVIALGYQTAEADIPPALVERELAPRRRKPLGDIACVGMWGNAYPGHASGE